MRAGLIICETALGRKDAMNDYILIRIGSAPLSMKPTDFFAAIGKPAGICVKSRQTHGLRLILKRFLKKRGVRKSRRPGPKLILIFPVWKEYGRTPL